MLETLTIQNLAVIDRADIPFKEGLNILSGETGAGKSMVIAAISLLLGGRASADLIRAGCDEATVIGLFDVGRMEWVRERMRRLGFETDGAQLLVKRVVHRGGRHRVYVNGELATVAILEELCEGLVDLCGQHEHQSLLKGSIQRELVDRFGGLGVTAGKYGDAFAQYRSLRKEHEMLSSADEERARRADFLKFQVDEIREAGPEVGEDERLAGEKKLLQSAEGRAQLAEQVIGLLDSEEGALSSLRGAVVRARSLAQMDGEVAGALEALERGLAEAEDASQRMARYQSSVNLDPERLIEVQDRLVLLGDLKRKYGATIAAVQAHLSQAENEFMSLGQVGERREVVAAELTAARADLERAGKKLSQARRKVSELLAASVTAELRELRMSEAKLEIAIEVAASVDEWGESGADQVSFRVQTNPGEAARPLGKIASGGELSRMMLAIRRVISDRGGIGVYLFDEIDAGIGGQTAFEVGRKLKSVSKSNQVICITHLPQVASFADHHLVVSKSVQGKRTVTEVNALTAKDRREEIARMLGGAKVTAKSLENASELLQLAGR